MYIWIFWQLKQCLTSSSLVVIMSKCWFINFVLCKYSNYTTLLESLAFIIHSQIEVSQWDVGLPLVI